MLDASNKRTLLVTAVVFVPLLFLVAAFSSEEKGFLTALAAGVFYVLVDHMPEYRGRPRFWAALAGLAVAHGVVLYAVRVPDRIAPAGIMLAPFAGADWLLMYLGLRWWMRGRA
ncbi:MAG TPA: hypothetical protein VGD56_21645 [Gemmatirosa sp.]